LSRKVVLAFWALIFYVWGLWAVATVAESLSIQELLLYKGYSAENSSGAIFESLMLCLGLAWGDYMESRATVHYVRYYPAEEFTERIKRFLDVVVVVAVFCLIVVVPQSLASLVRGV
jgi:hypothetical protein